MKEPNQKAKELVEKFNSISGHIRFSEEYALICVDEIIKSLEPWKNSFMGRKQIKELEEVKQSIKEL